MKPLIDRARVSFQKQNFEVSSALRRFFEHGRLVVLALGLVIGVQPAFADSPGEPVAAKKSQSAMIEERLAEMPSGEEGVNRIVAELDARLTLSAEQKKDVREVVAGGVADLEKLRGRYESGELTAMAFGVQIQMRLQKLAVLIEPLLEPKQQAEYKVMRQEQRREMMRAMQQQRKGSTQGP
jgi:hypothetical protein